MKLHISISKASSDITRKTISEKDVGPYIERKEIWYHFSAHEGTEMHSAYTHDGAYIGNADDAKHLYKKYGIVPELSKEDHSVCSIGKSDKDGKWYGWSHRALYGFQIGDKIKKGDCGFDPEVGEYTIKTEEEAKQAAKNFAESVSSMSSISSFAQKQEEKKVLNYLQHGHHDPKYEGNSFANSYLCVRWTQAVLNQLEVFGWTPQQEALYPDQHGTYHLVHEKGNEICAVEPMGSTFRIEFPRM